MKKFLFLLWALMLLTMTGKAQTSCISPTNLNATLHAPEWDNVRLNWNMNTDTSDLFLNYGCVYGNNQIGTTSANDFIGAVRFSPTQLAAYNGMYLTAVTFVPTAETSICTYHIMVWQGGSLEEGTFNEGTLVVDQEVTTSLIIGALNTVPLEESYEFDATQELWIGIRSAYTTGAHPLGVSTLTPVNDFGELIAFTADSLEWNTLSGYDLNYNWLIAGTLSNDPNPTIATLTGFNVYRDYEFLATVETSNYLDTLDPGTYVYGVTAVYSNDCESDPVTKTVTLVPNPCTTCEDTVLIGIGTTMNAYFPTYMYYNYSFTEQIYTVQEIGEINGTIPCIAFQYNYSTAATRDITIYMGNTSQSSFSGNSWIPGSELQQVFNGTVDFNNSADGHWVNIPLDLPFEYDGSSNIVVAVRDNTGSYLSSDARFLTHSATAKSLYTYRDASPYELSQLPSASTASVRNNIRFMVGEPVACSTPTHFTISEISTSSAVISWDENEESTGYELTIVPQGSSEEPDPIVLNENTYEVNELTPNTTYTVSLRAVCSSDNSAYVTATFHTSCVPETELPYVLNFDNMGTGSNILPPCSERGMGNTGGSAPYVDNTNSHSGNASLYFDYNNYSTSMIRLAGLDLTENEQPLVMSFYEYKDYASYGEVEVGFMTDPSDFSTFVTVKHVYPDDIPVDTWKEFRFGLPDSVNGKVIYPAFYVPTDNYTDFYVDDVTISVGDEDCFAPENLQASNVAYISAQISWTPVTPNATYLMHYTIDGDELAIPVELEEGATSHLLTGLTAGTTYTVYMYSDCENTTDTVSVSFITLSNSMVICLTPDTTLQPINIGATGTSYQMPLNSFYNYSYTQQIFTSEEIGEANVLSAISFLYDYSTAMYDQSDVEIYLAHCTDSAFASTNSWIPIAFATKVYEGPMNCSQGWNTYEFTTDFNYNGTSNVVLIVNNKSGNYITGGSSFVFKTHTKTPNTKRTLYVYTDNSEYDLANPGAGSTSAMRNVVRFTGCSESTVIDITCFEPTISVAAYDSTHITVEWVPGGDETQWVIEYMAEGDTLWTTEGSVSNTNSYTIENLVASTNYLIRMRSVCSGSDSSNWVTIPAFTICEFIDVPYFEDFELVDTEEDEFIPCWSRYSSEEYYLPYVDQYTAYSGDQSLSFYSYYANSFAIMPRFNDEVPMDSLTVKFSAYVTSTGYSIQVGVMSDPNDPTSFVSIGTVSPTSPYVWTNYDLNTSSYTGNGHYLAFKTPSNAYITMNIDDIAVTYFNPCQHPTNVTLDSVSTETAVLTWTPGAEETNWEYVYGLAGTVDLEEAEPQSVEDTTVVLYDLTDYTDYDFYVRAVCDAPSDWESFTFTTTCLPFTVLPYVQNFDSMTTATTNLTTGNSNLSDCWDALSTGTDYTSYPWVYSGSYYSHSGNYSLAFYTYSSSYYNYGSQYAFLPVLDPQFVPYEGLMLEFMMKNNSSSDNFTLVVGITEGVDISTFVPVDTVVSTSLNYEMKSVSFSGYEGNGNRIAIVAHTPTTEYTSNSGYIDNIVLSAPTCIHPNDLEVTEATTNSITLDWNERGDAENWVIEYGPAGFEQGEGEMVAANIHPFPITGLTASTLYDFYVRALCSESDTSAYSVALTAATDCDVVNDFPFTETFNSSDLGCWTNETLTGTNEWTISSSYSVDGSSAYFPYTRYNSARLISPVFNLSGINEPTVSFYHRQKEDAGVADSLVVSYRTSDEAEWVRLAAYTVPTGETFALDSLTLPEASATYQICFTGYGIFGYSIYLDNVTVFGANDSTPTPPTPTLPTVTTGTATFTQTTATLNATITNPDDVAITAKGFQWKVNGGEYQDATGAGTGNTFSAELSELAPSTQYYFKAYITTADTTVFGEELYFTTLPADVDTCATPTGLNTTDITKESIKVIWDNVDGVTWHIQYRQGDGAFSSADANTNSYVITDLNPETLYEIQVQADCGDGNVSAWATTTATTLADGVNSYLENSVVLYPNPAKEVINVECRMMNDEYVIDNIQVYDVYGKLINTVPVTDNITTLNVSSLANGMYFVRVTTEQGVVTKRFVKK